MSERELIEDRGKGMQEKPRDMGEKRRNAAAEGIEKRLME